MQNVKKFHMEIFYVFFEKRKSVAWKSIKKSSYRVFIREEKLRINYKKKIIIFEGFFILLFIFQSIYFFFNYFNPLKNHKQKSFVKLIHNMYSMKSLSRIKNKENNFFHKSSFVCINSGMCRGKKVWALESFAICLRW